MHTLIFVKTYNTGTEPNQHAVNIYFLEAVGSKISFFPNAQVYHYINRRWNKAPKHAKEQQEVQELAPPQNNTHDQI